MASPPHVVDVIPFKERYSVTTAGAIALCVDQLAGVSKARTTVFGTAVADPLQTARLQSVRPFFFTTRLAAAYVMGWEALFYFEGVRRALRAARPDVIQVHNRPLLAVMLQKEFPDIPVFLFLHNDPMSMKELRPPKNIGGSLHRLAGIVALSDWIEQRLYEAAPAVPRDLVHRIPNVVDCAAAAETDEAILAAKERVALFVGRINGGKGAAAFAEAAARVLPDFPDWKAVAIGAFQIGTTDCSHPSDYQRSFLAAVASHPNIAFLGPRPFPETMDWMRRAAILAIPSRHAEAFARVAVEGMMNGDALIVCKKGGALPEVAPEASGALHIEDATVDEIADALRRLMADDQDRLARARQGRAYAASHYAPAAVAAMIEAMYAAGKAALTAKH
ncbi:glycosyltransferase family 4 protein [Zavarzinia aquatilis]|uniref:Uncharacterized protein n=1 Tax=Zavarzinia aquatilis TaxID=2211142 RepID=A0A317E738_9PROT|nr:glycosyltransferase family 4 protein [Zavarzinia aquatilis]PWR21223.1 hypothetical protein DKG74_14565 [Zavarzinia aquatilis]